MHLVLVGDSIFDNAPYTRGEPEVIVQVRDLLPKNWRATLLALDGSTTRTVLNQLGRMPADATHLVLSVGGNDALWRADIVTSPVRRMSEALSELAELGEKFEQNYRRVVFAFHELKLPLILSTIYDGYFPDREYQRLASTALTHFNDVILRVGFELGLTVIDLRFICSQPDDYANPIEPSSVGGAKIARAIVNALLPADCKDIARVITS